MNPTKLLAFFLSVLIFGSVISTVNATITREYTKDSYNTYGHIRFTYKVKIIIETDANEVWLVGRTYQVTYTITLTYLNQSIFSPSGFYIVFHSPSGTGVLVNSTTLSLGNSGSISFQASETYETRFTLNPSMAYELYVDNKFFEHGYWFSNEPIFIDVKSPSQPSQFSSELIFMAIGILIGAVAIGSYFIMKTRKK